MTNSFRIYTDGASRGNPGPAAAAYIFLHKGDIIYSNSLYLGKETNNSAEYQAILNALLDARKFTDNTISLFSDSQLIVRQLNGVYKVKSKNLSPYFIKIKTLKKNFKSISFTHVNRTNQYIRKCDALANQTLDTHK